MKLNQKKIRKILLAIIPGMIVSCFVYASNIYYDLDLQKIVSEESQRISNEFDVTSTTTLATVSGYVGIGTSSPAYTLDLAGTFRVTGTSTLGLINSNLIPDTNATRDIGSPSYYWDDVYVDNIVANNISAASITIAGTASNNFTLNSDNATADTENIDLIFFRGTASPNALLTWDSTNKRFDYNQPVYIQNDNSTTTVVSLNVWGTTNQTASLLNIASSTGSSLFSIASNGDVSLTTVTSGTWNGDVISDTYVAR
jgi:hypothetical protein